MSSKFKIGDWVRAEVVAVVKTEWRSRSCIKERMVVGALRSVRGQIVGATRMYGGKLDYSGDEGRVFFPRQPHAVWLVREGLLNKPIPVFERNLFPCAPPKNGLPLMKQDQSWTKTPGNRRIMRGVAASLKRDAKGRWAK